MNPTIAYAVVFEKGLCYTSEEVTGGTVFQVYKTREEAEDFCALPFGDATYDVVEVMVVPIIKD